jgi:diguanylate cyclase (GGDEF)-like protein/PAS domain S-box-containing protein
MASQNSPIVRILNTPTREVKRVESRAHRPPAFTRARLLVVDDEPLMMRSLAELLNMHGFEVVMAESGERAIELLAEEDFEVALIDLRMPGKDGFAVMESVNKRANKASLIVVSGDGTTDAAIRALRQGAYDFLRKPYEPEELLRTVENAINRRRLEREYSGLTEKLEVSERLHRYLVNQSPDVIYTLDAAGRFTFLNDRIETLLGYSREELIGRHYTYLIFEDDIDRAKFVFNERRTGARAARDIELRLKIKRRPSDSPSAERHLTVEFCATGIYEEKNATAAKQFRGTYGVAKDVSERKRAQEAIYHQAYHDLLTGLPNRLLFRDRLNLAVAQAKRSGHMLAVMFVDLDRFKIINDTLGHIVGDQLLQAIATRVSKCVREGDTLARMGGDEFVLLLPQITTREAVENAAKKILGVMAQPFKVGSQEHSTGASIGIAVFPDDGDTMDVLVKNADIAMYDVKAQGRNGYAFFTETQNVSYANRLNLENDLRTAVGKGQFELFYQPIVSARTGEPITMEALLRWNHPTRGRLLPGEFISLAEETGAIDYLSEWAVRTACAQANAWRAQGLPPVRLALNISAQQVEARDFVAKLSETLHAAAADLSSIELEITESTMMRDVSETQAKLVALTQLGVRIAIDDFGTGYSSLSYLRTLPIDAIKIDRSFVSDIRGTGENSIVAAMMLIAKGLSLEVIAEGVETWEQYEFLRDHGCDEMQGFLISTPLDAADATTLLASRRSLLPPQP